MSNKPLTVEVDDRPDFEYTVVLYNEKHQRKEVFNTKAKDDYQLNMSLALFLDNGYKLIQCEQVIK